MTQVSLKPHILIVDDEQDIREPVATYLGMNGFDVTTASNSAEALAAAAAKKPDLALLDIVLGNENGIDLCKSLHQMADIAVIFLSGKSDETERIIGLEVGADDYIVKPFNPRELLARVKAVLRRAGQPSQKQSIHSKRIAFGPWVFDPTQHELTDGNGQSIALSSGETTLLMAFLEQPRYVFSRDQLMDIMQGRNLDIFDRSIDNYIARLRKKVETNPSEPKIIKTHWGKGYALSCDREILS